MPRRRREPAAAPLGTAKAYRLGIFMVGAYQETLGDIHNLFGDTDAVNVRAGANGYEFRPLAPRRHDDLMLDYVGYDLPALRASYRDASPRRRHTGVAADQLYGALNPG